MNYLDIPKIRWGANIVPWTLDIQKHHEIGIRDFRSNWCRFNPASWSKPEFDAGNWTLEDSARQAKEVIAAGGRYVEVLVDRQNVIPGAKNDTDVRVGITKAILLREPQTLKAIFEEVREVRNAMPKETYGELFNGDEFGQGCGFPWDPNTSDFWNLIGQPRLHATRIRDRFTQFEREIAQIWGLETFIAKPVHVYTYPDGRIGSRGNPSATTIATEVGIYESFFDDPFRVWQLQNTLIKNGITWAFWHQPWPGNPGDGKSFAEGNKFTYDRAKFDSWRGTRSWPEYEGIMLRDAANALVEVFCL